MEGWNRNLKISQLPWSNLVFFLLHVLLWIESDVPFVASFLPKEKASLCTSALLLLNPVTRRSWRVVGFTPNPELSVYSSSFTTVEPRMMFSTSGCESMTRPTRAAVNWSSLRAFQVGKEEERKMSSVLCINGLTGETGVCSGLSFSAFSCKAQGRAERCALPIFRLSM